MRSCPRALFRAVCVPLKGVLFGSRCDVFRAWGRGHLGTARFIGQPPMQLAPPPIFPPLSALIPSQRCSKTSFDCFLDSGCGAAVQACGEDIM